MPTIEFNKRNLIKTIGKKLNDEQLSQAITYLGTAPETIEKETIKVEVFPNRPDLLTEAGMGRALRGFLGMETGKKHYAVEKAKYDVICTKELANIRPHTSCCVIKGITLDNASLNQIIQAQEKLHITFGRNRARCAIGIYPLDKITFPITFTAKKANDIRFTPLDGKKNMDASSIIKEHPAGKTYGHLLGGTDKYPVFIDAKGTILSMPPIINSEEAGRVTATTTDLFVECSGHSTIVLDTCLAILATMLASYGGKIYAVTIHTANGKRTVPDLSGTEMTLDPAYVTARTGLQLKISEMVDYLRNMGHDAHIKNTTTAKRTETKDRENKLIHVTVPSYREDILHPIDLVEDICIAYGYNNIQPQPHPLGTTANQSRTSRLIQKCNELLIGLGFMEVSTFAVTAATTQEDKMNGSGKIQEHVVRINNPTSEEYNAIAAWLTPSLMHVLQTNKMHTYPQQIQTAGRVVVRTGDGKFKEENRIALTICDDKATYTTIKQNVEYTLSRIGLKDWTIIPSTHPSFISGRAGRIVINNKSIGFIGEIHPQVIVNFGLQYPVVSCELLIDKIEELLYP